MVWWLSATVLFGALTGLLDVGLAAAFAFFGINVVGAWVWLGKDAGLVQMIRNGVASISSFSLTPIPFFVLMGEVLFHTGVAMKAIDAIARAIGGVDMLIPPSALTVLLGSLAGISIAELLIAGIMPGVLLAVAFVAYIVVRAVTDPSLAPMFEHERVSGGERWGPL